MEKGNNMEFQQTGALNITHRGIAEVRDPIP
jgi:hypothetical protein